MAFTRSLGTTWSVQWADATPIVLEAARYGTKATASTTKVPLVTLT
jgi:hypothetical protein